jgi:hypothetical protein
MIKKKFLTSCLTASLMMFISPMTQSAEEGLVDYMTALQYFSHKAGLAIRGGNLELADFYMHEIEEALEGVAEIESYDGHPVGALSEMMAVPVESVGGGLDAGSTEDAMAAYQSMLDTCNVCHVATEHGFIKIVDNSMENPYMQAFD